MDVAAAVKDDAPQRLWSPLTEARPLYMYAGLFVVVPLALSLLLGSWSMFTISALVTAGITVAIVTMYVVVVPRFPAPRTTVQLWMTHGIASAAGTTIGALPAAAIWAWAYDYPLGVVYWNILRISAVVSPVVMGGLWLADRPGRLAASAKVPPSAEPMRLQARDASGMRWFDVSDITRLYATDKYVAFRMEGREYLLDESLTALAERLAAAGFLRTHRSELVNRRHVQAFEGSTLVLSDGQQARVSRRAAARVRRALSDR